MPFYDAFAKNGAQVAGYHDKDSIRTFGIIFQPVPWAANTVYTKPYDDDYEIVIPTVFTGLYYKVKNPGKSGATEPTWVMEAGEETPDGTKGLIWEAVNYNLLPVIETISTVTFTATSGITLTNTSNTTTSAHFTIPALPAAAIAAGKFEVTAHAVKNTGDEFDVTLKFTVGER